MSLNSFKDKRIIITGCGFKPIKHIFKDLVTGKPTHTELIVNKEKCKLNVGSAIAYSLLEVGATVHMISRSKENLEQLANAFCNKLNCNENLIEYSAVDVLDEEQVKNFVKNLKKDKDIYWVQSIGLGAGSYKIKGDNPYLPLEEIDIGLIEAESKIVLRGTHLFMQQILPLLKKQKESRIVIISSLSATRGYDLGGTHCAAKGAIDRYANSAMLGLVKHNIFLTTVRPGIIDTGFYDSEDVIKAVKHVGKEYGWEYQKDNIPLASPSAVGNLVREILSSNAHITSVNLVAQKQFPNEAS
ncbi:MAG: SDR family NAD(P)-dependent oxidoreductase [Nanoarchaeota archaeon]